MNYRMAMIAAGASIVGLLILAGALVVCIAATIDLSIFASGPQPGEQLLWFLLLPAAASLASALLTNVLNGRWQRSTMAAASAFSVTFLLVYADLASNTTPSGAGELFVALALLLMSPLSVLTATVDRTDISYSRMRAILVLTVALVGGASVATMAVSTASVEASVLIAMAAWILVPTLAALLIPPSFSET